MSERYLWGKSGPPDPLMQQLEQSLAPLAGKPGELPHAIPLSPPRLIRFRAPIAAAAAMFALFAWHGILSTHPQSAWLISSASGQAHINKSPLRGVSKVGVNEWLETGDDGRVELRVGQIGSITIEPDSRLRVLRSEAQQQRMELVVGEISAMIFAPPRLFVVQTPSATAVDLGCAYRLRMQSDGSGVLTVTAGWVALERHGAEVYVPSGAACRICPGVGPGLPWFRDASAAFREAVERWDAASAIAASSSSQAPQAAFDDILRTAGRRDTLTLWHLLSEASTARREKILARIVEVASPRGANAIQESRAALLVGDASAISSLRAALRQDW